MSLYVSQYRQWVLDNFAQIKKMEDFAAMGAALLMSGVGLPNAEALGEAVGALIKIFKAVNDRIYALDRRALTVYATDGLRLAVSALAQLSLSVEMFSGESGRSATVLGLEAVRLALRVVLLVRSGFDVLVHGGKPDALAVHLEPVDVPEGAPEDAELPPPRIKIVGGDAADTSRVRSLWWLGAESGKWLNMPPHHPGAVAETCRRAHLPAVWQLVLSESLLVLRPFVEAVLRHAKPGKHYWLSTLAAFVMDGASVHLLSQVQAEYGAKTSSADVVKAEIWRRKLGFKSFLFREPVFSFVLGALVRKIQAGFDYIPLLRNIVRFVVGTLLYWQKFFYWSVPP